MADLAEKDKKYKIYSVDHYNMATINFINNNYDEYNIDELIEQLEEDNKYHFRILNNTTYIFFGDLDGYDESIEIFAYKLNKYMEDNYKLSFIMDEFKYTCNKNKKGSYHYSIPKWNLQVENLKKIITSLKKDENLDSIIDTTIYSNHWFRCPNQSKGFKNDITIHNIITGSMIDFIVEHIPSNSINIDGYVNINYSENNHEDINKIIIPKNTSNEIALSKNNETNILTLASSLTKSDICKRVFDECYAQKRFELYEYWISIGMAITNIFDDINEAIELFNYYSAKGSNYEGYESTKLKLLSFIKKNDGYTVATIYYYALEDNKPKFIEIMNKNTFELTETDICKYIKTIAGFKYIYKNTNGIYKLYCYNGIYWQQDDILLRKYIGNELYEFLKKILVNVYWDAKDFNILKTKLEKLKSVNYKKNIVETYKEEGVNNTIKYDDKWWLFGFTNYVYDMKESNIREYCYSDYVSITTGYEWVEPTNEDILYIENLINKIMPDEDEKKTYLDILCTSIDGRCLEKFIIFNGGGRNGKGMINDLLLHALGNYGIISNNNLLFESSKTGSNPEKANIHKKRLVIFREPPEKNKFENSIIKELTGGGKFSARGHHESTTEKELNLTMIVECNRRPLLAEEPQKAEIDRIIDIYFRSTFTLNIDEIDHKNHIYQADPYLKTQEFKEKYKFAFLKILFNTHKEYTRRNNNLYIANTIKERTKNYLELSCNIVQWFKENYTHTNNQKDVIKITDIYDKFKISEYFTTLTKQEKKKYNKTFFMDYIQNNSFFRPYYNDRYNNIRNILRGWIEIITDDIIYL